MAGVRLVVRAKPGSRKESVTVAAHEGESEVVVVRVQARAVDGAANTAVVKAVAAALGVRRSAITVTVGTSNSAFTPWKITRLSPAQCRPR